MTDYQWALIRALAKCTFYPGSFDKRFMHDLAEKPKTAELSEKQDLQLRRIGWSKRAQLGQSIEVTRPPELGPDPEEVASQRDRAKLAAWNAGIPIREKAVDDLFPDDAFQP